MEGVGEECWGEGERNAASAGPHSVTGGLVISVCGGSQAGQPALV